MEYISRPTRRARPTRKPFSRLRSSRVVGIVLHHSGVSSPPEGVDAVKSYARYHMDTRGWNAIAYNWLVDERGVIYEGRGPGIVSGATKHYNFKTESICFRGYGGRTVPETALISIKEVIEDIQSRYGGRRWVKGHKDLASTTCPGSELYAWLQNGSVLYEGNPTTIDFEAIAKYLRDLGKGLDKSPLSRRKRSRGQLVQLAQGRLRDRGHDCGAIDGVFGHKTKGAVKSFQKKFGFLRPNGVIDRQTWDCMFLV